MTDNSPNFKKLLQEEDAMHIPKAGDLIKGKIISITRSEVRIDINGVKTGVVRGRELFDESSEYSNLKTGDDVEATVLEQENEKGEVELSFRFAGHQRAWDGLIEFMKNKQIVSTRITDANKGGLMIRVGQIAGFLPVSQLSPEHYPRVPGGDKNKILERLKDYIGKDFEVKIIDVNEGENKLIVSEKAAWEEKQHSVISKYKIADVIEGSVTAVTDFGVFVEFGEHLEGLIHISELAWQRIDNPRDIIKEGEKIKAEIIGMEGSKIFLSSKKLKKDPWEGIEKKYSVGQSVKGKILKINPFGLFVELDSDIHGLAHISEISNEPVGDLSKMVAIGDMKEFKILSIEPKNHRLGLSLKKFQPPQETKETIKTEIKEKEKKKDKKEDMGSSKEKKPREKKKIKAKKEA